MLMCRKRRKDRIAMRALMGLARTGSYASNGSGDYVIAFSTNRAVRIRRQEQPRLLERPDLDNEAMSALFLSVAEATEEAILNSLWAATTMTGYKNRTVQALPVDGILAQLRKQGIMP